MASGIWNDNYRTIWQDCSYDYNLLTTDSGTKTAVAAKTGFTVFVQAIVCNFHTDAAQTLTFQDDAGTPVVIHKTRSSPGLGPVDDSVDFGPEGKALTADKGLNMVISGAGLGAAIKVIMYRKPTATS